MTMREHGCIRLFVSLAAVLVAYGMYVAPVATGQPAIGTVTKAYRCEYGDSAGVLKFRVEIQTVAGKPNEASTATDLESVQKKMAIIYSDFSFESGNDGDVQKFQSIGDKLNAFTYSVTLDDTGQVTDSDFSDQLKELLAKYEGNNSQLEKTILPLVVATWRGIVPGRTTSGELIDKRDWHAFKHDKLIQMAESSQTGVRYRSSKSPKTQEFVYWMNVTELTMSETRGDAETVEFEKDIEIQLGLQPMDPQRKQVKSVNIVFTTTFSEKGKETNSLKAFFRAYLAP